MFLSGSLHFGIKFYCSDEDESSKLLFFRAFLLPYRRLGLTNRYFDIDNDESHSKMFLSGSLHFGIKFYCSDEDESSRLCLLFARSYCC